MSLFNELFLRLRSAGSLPNEVTLVLAVDAGVLDAEAQREEECLCKLGSANTLCSS